MLGIYEIKTLSNIKYFKSYETDIGISCFAIDKEGNFYSFPLMELCVYDRLPQKYKNKKIYHDIISYGEIRKNIDIEHKTIHYI